MPITHWSKVEGLLIWGSTAIKSMMFFLISPFLNIKLYLHLFFFYKD